MQIGNQPRTFSFYVSVGWDEKLIESMLKLFCILESREKKDRRLKWQRVLHARAVTDASTPTIEVQLNMTKFVPTKKLFESRAIYVYSSTQYCQKP